MPAGLLPSEGIADLLENILKRSIGGVLAWELMLWTNDVQVGAATVLGDLVEATFGGYSRITLTRDEWTTPVVEAGCAHSTWRDTLTGWGVYGPPLETIYGYGYVDVTTGVLRFAQRLDTEDIEQITVGGKVYILPAFTLTSGECSIPNAGRIKPARKAQRK
jgi:hypothetical protein